MALSNLPHKLLCIISAVLELVILNQLSFNYYSEVESRLVIFVLVLHNEVVNDVNVVKVVVFVVRFLHEGHVFDVSSAVFKDAIDHGEGPED